MILYGTPGVGKTHLLASGGRRTLILRPPTDHVPSGANKQADEIILQGHNDTSGAHAWLAREGHEKYDWVWLDSISLFQDHGLQDLFEDAVARNPARAEAGWDKKEYGLNQQRIGGFIRDMVGLANAGKINFGITAHPMEWYNPVEEKDMWAPAIQGGQGVFMTKVCGMMNVVAFYHEARKDKEIVRVLRTKGKTGMDIVVKDQRGLGGSTGKLLNPSMADIDAALGTNKATAKRKATTTKRTARRRTT